MLVHLEQIDAVELAELLEDAWGLRALNRVAATYDAGAGSGSG